MMEVRGTIDRLVRRQNSPDGNPRFSVIMSGGGGSFLTKKDAQVNFIIPNFEGKNAVLTLDDNGEIVEVRADEEVERFQQMDRWQAFVGSHIEGTINGTRVVGVVERVEWSKAFMEPRLILDGDRSVLARNAQPVIVTAELDPDAPKPTGNPDYSFYHGGS